jgi:mono/diheme cytochrome c family protein
MATCGLRRHGFLGINFFAVVLMWLMPGQGLAQQEEIAKAGRPTYEQYCAVCHGPAGKGDGGAANILTVKPADLTQLSKKSGGEFPFWRMYRIIDGREEEIKGHGSREMPIWGKELRATAGSGNPGAESAVRGKILELIYYLQSIQEK